MGSKKNSQGAGARREKMRVLKEEVEMEDVGS